MFMSVLHPFSLALCSWGYGVAEKLHGLAKGRTRSMEKNVLQLVVLKLARLIRVFL